MPLNSQVLWSGTIDSFPHGFLKNETFADFHVQSYVSLSFSWILIYLNSTFLGYLAYRRRTLHVLLVLYFIGQSESEA